MSPDPAPLCDPLVELRYALGEADAQAPPDSLRERVIHAALAARPAGSRAVLPASITTVEAYRQTVAT